MLRIFVLFITLILSSVLYPSNTIADYTFIDNFDSGLNPNWLYIQNHLSPVVSNSKLLFNVDVVSSTFPYIAHQSTDPIKSFRLDFRYDLKGSDFGSGIVLTENIPLQEISPPNDSGDYILAMYVLSDGYYYLFSPLCTSLGNCGLAIHPHAIYKFNPGTEYYVVFNFSQNSLDVYIDYQLIKSLPMSLYRADGFFIGNSMVTSTPKIWQKYVIDNLFIEYGQYDLNYPIPSHTPTPSVLPSPSLTASPSPTPIPSPSAAPSMSPRPSPSPSPSVSPSVSPSPAPIPLPYLSQSDPIWGKQLYDHADHWAEPNKRSIANWGCALTSATMVLQKYGVKNYSQQPVNPAQLNAWLKIQDDGYLGNGLLNWLAVTRFVHQAKIAGRAPTELEFTKEKYSEARTVEYLNAAKLPILGLPGHFVTSYSHNLNSYSVHDPANPSRLSLSKLEPIGSINVFSPSNTDLSYLLFTYQPGLHVKVKSENGTELIGDEYEEYVKDERSESTTSKLLMRYFPKPESGKYILEIDNPGDEKKIKAYFYDEVGNVSIKQREIKEHSQTAIKLNYDKKKVTRCDFEYKWLWTRFHFFPFHFFKVQSK